MHRGILVSLRGLDFHSVDFHGVEFHGVEFHGVDFNRVGFHGAWFVGGWDMKNTIVGLAVRLSMIFAMGIWTSSWELRGAEQVEPAEQAGGVGRVLKGQTQVGGYRIEFVGIGELDGSQGVTRLRPEFAKGMFGANGARAGGEGFGGAFVMPNQGIALKVTDLEEGKRKKGDLLFEMGSAVELVEFNGSVSASKDMGPIARSWPSFEQQFPGCSAVYVNRKQGIETDFRELSGELRVTPGRRTSVEFKVGRKKGIQKKRVEGEEFALESIEVGPQGVEVVVRFPLPKRMEQLNDPIAMMQMLSQGGEQVELEDSEGERLVPSGMQGSNGMQGGEGIQGMNGFSGGSFSFGGNSAGGFSFQSNFQGQVVGNGGGAGNQAGGGKRLSFRFDPLGEGREIRLVRVIREERTGDTEVIPFKIMPEELDQPKE
jgi:hypothetical protein